MFEVILSPEAKTFFARADRPLARKLARSFAQLERDPRRHNNIKRLTGALAGRWRYRVGDYRVLCQILDNKLIVLVVAVGHRGKVYR